MRALAVVGIRSPGLMHGKRKKLVRCEDLPALYRQSGDDPNQVLEWHKMLAGGFHRFNVLYRMIWPAENHKPSPALPEMGHGWYKLSHLGVYSILSLSHVFLFSILWDDP